MAAKQRRAYEELRAAIEARGGTMIHERAGQPRGGAWIVTLGAKTGRFVSHGNGYSRLDELYIPKPGLIPTHYKDYTKTLRDGAVDDLLAMLE